MTITTALLDIGSTYFVQICSIYIYLDNIGTTRVIDQSLLNDQRQIVRIYSGRVLEVLPVSIEDLMVV